MKSVNTKTSIIAPSVGVYNFIKQKSHVDLGGREGDLPRQGICQAWSLRNGVGEGACAVRLGMEQAPPGRETGMEHAAPGRGGRAALPSRRGGARPVHGGALGGGPPLGSRGVLGGGPPPPPSLRTREMEDESQW
jgi:hypothetical protein